MKNKDLEFRIEISYKRLRETDNETEQLRLGREIKYYQRRYFEVNRRFYIPKKPSS
jgi:hypothetical protein